MASQFVFSGCIEQSGIERPMEFQIDFKSLGSLNFQSQEVQNNQTNDSFLFSGR